MKVIENQIFDMERALYGSEGVLVRECSFDGPADGESAFKEGRDIETEHCFFNLRYPFWHDHGLKISDSEMTELCRAALWYSGHIEITDSKLHGIKALRTLKMRHSKTVYLIRKMLSGMAKCIGGSLFDSNADMLGSVDRYPVLDVVYETDNVI